MPQPKSASAVTRDSAEAETHSPDDCQDFLRGGGDTDAGRHSLDSDSSYTNETASQEDGRTVKKRKIGEMFLMVCSRRREARELGKIEKNESRFAMDRLSSMDDVMLNAIFRHFAHPYVPTMPMVGTCRKVFLTWRKRRRDLALEMVRELVGRLRAFEEVVDDMCEHPIGLRVFAFFCRSVHIHLRDDVINLIR